MAQTQNSEEKGSKRDNNQQEKRASLPKKHLSQIGFQIAAYVLAAITIFCVPGFLKFRNWAVQNNFLVLKTESVWWVIPGFFIMLVLKFFLNTEFVTKILLSCLSQEDKIKKQSDPEHLKLVKIAKDLRETFVHSIFVIVTFILFRGEYWFTWLLGGNGDHSEAFREYPSWPTHLSTQIQIFFMIQLGINIYHLFDVLIFNREFFLARNYYEMLMHHIATVTSIIFSTLCNVSAIGILIFFVHDVSDLFRAACQVYTHTKWAKFMPTIVLNIIFLGMWIYNRLVIFPYCLIYVLEEHAPSEGDILSMIFLQYWFLIILFCSLYVLHVFWSYLLIRSTYKKAMLIRHWQKLDQQNQLKKE